MQWAPFPKDWVNNHKELLLEQNKIDWRVSLLCRALFPSMQEAFCLVDSSLLAALAALYLWLVTDGECHFYIWWQGVVLDIFGHSETMTTTTTTRKFLVGTLWEFQFVLSGQFRGLNALFLFEVQWQFSFPPDARLAVRRQSLQNPHSGRVAALSQFLNR